MKKLFDLNTDELAEIIDRRLTLHLSNLNLRPRGVDEPIHAAGLDRVYHLRSGTAGKAIRAGQLKACRRPGRGGMQHWVEPKDASDWLSRGCPTHQTVI